MSAVRKTDTQTELIRLATILAARPEDEFDNWCVAAHEENQIQAIRAIARHQGHPLVRRFLTLINESASPSETEYATLRRASQLAAPFLQALKKEEARLNQETARERYRREQADYDPWFADVNLTDDALGLRPEPEPEIEVRLDSAGNIARS